MLGLLAISIFVVWLIAYAVPREAPVFADRQTGDVLNTTYSPIRPACRADALSALPAPLRAKVTEGCGVDAERYRIEREGLNQSFRAANAAEEAVRLADQQARVAFSQALLTVLALCFTGWAAWAALRAARAAENAVEQSRDQSKTAQQAYVHVERAELKWGDEAGGKPLITLWGRNTGQTPARWFGARVQVFLTEANEPISKAMLENFDLGAPSEVMWSSLGGGGELTFRGSREADWSAFCQAYMTDYVLHVVGTLRYETIFDEVFETEFWFNRRGPHGYSLSKSEPRDQGEAPQKMTRAPVRLRTYEQTSASDHPKR